MSLSSLVSGSGTDCGPSNPLQHLSKTFGGDRGVQQDHFAPQAGPSRQAFRSHPQIQNNSFDAEAAQFFSSTHPTSSPVPSTPQSRHTPDFSQQSRLRATPAGSTPPAWAQDFMSISLDRPQPSRAEMGMMKGGPAPGPGPAWSNDFMRFEEMRQGGPLVAKEENIAALQHPTSGHAAPVGGGMIAARAGGLGRFDPLMGGRGWMEQERMGHSMMAGGPIMQQGVQAREGAVSEAAYDQMRDHAEASTWEKAFLAQTSSLSLNESDATGQALAEQTLRSDLLHRTEDVPRTSEADETRYQDELARTAGQLIQSVSHEQDRNAKWRDSEFLGLMRKLRDGECKVEGDRVVEQIGPVTGSSENRYGSSAGVGQQQQSSFDGAHDESLLSRGSSSKTGPICTLLNTNDLLSLDSLGTSSSFQTAGPSTGSRSGFGMSPGLEQAASTISNAMPIDQLEDFHREMNEMLHRDDLERASSASKGKGKEREVFGQDQPNPYHFQGDGGSFTDQEASSSSSAMEDQMPAWRADTSVPGAQINWEEDFDAADIVGSPYSRMRGPASRTRSTTGMIPNHDQQAEWDKLQKDWDDYEATSTGMSKRTETYDFQPNNPFLQGDAQMAESSQTPTTTHQHSLHSHPTQIHPSVLSPHNSILQKEAAAQMNPDSPQAWLELGLKQQENEREDLAIKALLRAVEIDPAHDAAWLALAVSYTNESERRLAYTAIEKWMSCKREEYGPVLDQYDREYNGVEVNSLTDWHQYLTGMLIAMARARGLEAEVDADVQIALGILFNTSEEYEKAGDCFAAALSVRPEDPVLYSRLGATLANSGKPEDATAYYFKALELQPAYVRARYNLAISCINLSKYKEAAEHLLGALAIQDADAVQATNDQQILGEENGGVTSSTLWETLKMVSQMLNRGDLAEFCTARDLDRFRGEFEF